MTTFPALETAIIIVSRIDSAERGDKLLWTIEGEQVRYPPQTIQVSTFSVWMSALCECAKKNGKPIEIGWRNYSHGDRRLVTCDWAS